MSKKQNIEPSRTFRVKKYGSSYMVILDKGLRSLLGINSEDVEEEIVGIIAENIRKVMLKKPKLKFNPINKFGEK